MKKVREFANTFADYDGFYEMSEVASGGMRILTIEADDLFCFGKSCEQLKYALAECEKIEIVPSEKYGLGLTIKFFVKER